MTVNAREVNMSVRYRKEKGNSGQTRTKHQFQNMNEITDTIKTKNVVFASKSRVQENKQDISNILAKKTNLNNVNSPLLCFGPVESQMKSRQD